MCISCIVGVGRRRRPRTDAEMARIAQAIGMQWPPAPSTSIPRPTQSPVASTKPNENAQSDSLR